MRLAHCLLALLLVAPAAGRAHVSGFTDTSVQIAATGVRVIYTVPKDNLLELSRSAVATRAGQGGASQTPAVPTDAPPSAAYDPASLAGPPDQYLSAVRAGWQLQSAGEPCLLSQARARALDSVPSYQFQLSWVCPQGLDRLSLRYSLFFAQWPEHENFVRMFMAGQRQRLRFTHERQELEVPVAQLLAQWGQPLAAGFFAVDPNQGLKSALQGAEDGQAQPQVAVPPPSLGSLSWAQLDAGFVRLGWQHIFMGLDHVLFVVGLVLLTQRPRRLLLLISAFTVAHSLTLALATLGRVAVPAAVAEPLIALTIVYIGLENLRALRPGSAAQGRAVEGQRALWLRSALVFVFGLVHGVGFSQVLSGMGLREDLLGALLMFNLGVELGQVVIVLAALPLLWLLHAAPARWPQRGKAAVALGIAATGLMLLAAPARAQASTTGTVARVGAPLPRDRLQAQGDLVYDRKTDLTWQRCTLGQRWDAPASRCRGEPQRIGFDEALALQTAPGGWRVPTLDELLSLVRPGGPAPAIDGQAFPDTPPLYFWATDNRDLGAAWYVNFDNGRANHYFPPRTNRDLLRLVRSGRWLGPQ